jgi:hypothetical protein
VHRDPASGTTRVLRRNFGRIWFNSDAEGGRDDARDDTGVPREDPREDDDG